MKFLGGIAGNNLSGSLGGVTASRNRSGSYFRNRTIPVNPGTTFQTAVRGFMASLSNHWIDTLTQLQREAWTTYAENVALIDALGSAIFVTGMNMYIRSNVPRLQAIDARQDDAPVIFDLGEFTNPSMTALDAGNALTVSFDNTDAWANEEGSAMIVYGSRPQNPTINFFKGPYRFANIILGDAVTPPTSPAIIVNPFPLASGQKVFAQVRVTRSDGRLSGTFRLDAPVV